MSIQNSTLHFHFPLVVGSDRPVFSDYNTTMELLDEQLYSAVSSITTFGEQIAALQDTSGEHTTELAELNTFKTEQDGINSANAARFLAINQTLGEQIVTNNNKFNSVSIADAYDATQTYSVGDVVTYNGDRYRCITAITTGEPFDADKWQGEDVQTVLDELNSNLANNVSLNTLTVTTDGVKTRAELFNELYSAFISAGYRLHSDSYISFQGVLYKYAGFSDSRGMMFNGELISGSQITTANINLKANASSSYVWVFTTSLTEVNDRGSEIPASGLNITLHCI